MLAQYVEFVETVKSYGPFGNDKEKLKDALATVIKEFIRDNKLCEFLQEHGDEVIEVETLDYTFERREELIKKDAYVDGQLSFAINLYKKQKLTLEEAAEELSITVEEFLDKL